MSQRHTLAAVSPRAPRQEVAALYSDRSSDATTGFGTYFSAFPASFWHNNTAVANLVLTVTLANSAIIRIFRSNSAGVASEISSAQLSGGVESSFPLELAGFEDGGWLWFTLESLDDSGPEIRYARWETEQPPVTQLKVSLGITTLNKVEYCLANLKALALDHELMERVDRIIVIDQGSDKLAASPGYTEVAPLLGTKLNVIEQSNLGGSGGFSRSMFEATQLPDTGFLLLLDDDVAIETESIKRALTFAQFCTNPTIVGGHMFDLHQPTVLHAFSEIIEPRDFFWTQRNPSEEFRHDFSQRPLNRSPWLHQYFESDYTGWWMCLIPTAIIRELGLSLPFFLKWDDAEYGLRAREAGYKVISLPGAALWHVSWLDKDEPQDWQAFFHVRNRIITAMLYSEYDAGGTVLSTTYQHSLKYLTAQQYYSVTLRNEAIRAVLGGPEALAGSLSTELPLAQSLKAGFSEITKHPQAAKPQNTIPRLKHTDRDQGRPTGLRLLGWLINNLPRHYFLPVSKNPIPAEFLRLQATWWRVAQYDAYIVPTAENDGSFYWFKRDRKLFLQLQKDNKKLIKQLKKNWLPLRNRYREAFNQLVSLEYWRSQFNSEGNS